MNNILAYSLLLIIIGGSAGTLYAVADESSFNAIVGNYNVNGDLLVTGDVEIVGTLTNDVIDTIEEKTNALETEMAGAKSFDVSVHYKLEELDKRLSAIEDSYIPSDDISTENDESSGDESSGDESSGDTNVDIVTPVNSGD